jgi:DNA repair photolyase
MKDVVFREIRCASALNRVKGMPFEWSLNPYKGCAHSCRYCFARAYHVKMARDVGAGFDREIDVKTNFAEVLRKELRKRPQGSVAIGTATDPFQPCEGRYRLTRRSLEALMEFPMPATIVTKSTLIIRDVDLLRDLTDASNGGLRVCFSIPTLNETVWRSAEPRTPPPAQRLRALAILRRAGVDAGVLCAPVLPGLTDSEESLDRVARAAADAGATFFGWRPLKIDPEIRDYYFDFLAAEFPVLTTAYMSLYANGSHASKDYQEALDSKVAIIRARYRFVEQWRPAKRLAAEVSTQLKLAM